MPDHNLAEPEAASGRPIQGSRKENSKTSSETSPKSGNDAGYVVHVVLNSKGGIGKSFVASLLGQWLRDHGRPVVCLDTDRLNASLSDVKALQAEAVPVIDDEGVVDIDAIDGIVDRLAKEEANFVIDSGSTSFAPLGRHLVTEGVADILGQHGKRMIAHAIVSGGSEFGHTVRGLDAMAKQFPASVGIVVWLNEHHGSIGDAEHQFESFPVYQKHKDRFLGVVRLAKLNPTTYGKNLAAMIGRGQTFSEAREDASLFIQTRQRLVEIQRPIWAQIGAVL
jgi:hypothetical protein